MSDLCGVYGVSGGLWVSCVQGCEGSVVRAVCIGLVEGYESRV